MSVLVLFFFKLESQTFAQLFINLAGLCAKLFLIPFILSVYIISFFSLFWLGWVFIAACQFSSVQSLSRVRLFVTL